VNIAAIMPCRGRPEQTIRNVRRLLATADYSHEAWRLICVVSQSEALLADTLIPLTGAQSPLVVVTPQPGRMTYWRALALVTNHIDATHLINLANDLVPGQHWLRRAVEGYQSEFGAMPGMLGFNGDSWGVEHSCHFMIARELLERYGGWPIWYDHNFGDTELCQRAIADNAYAKAAWALLFHDHPYFGGDDDAVYAEGRAQATKDERLYQQRKALGWPAVPFAPAVGASATPTPAINAVTFAGLSSA
jgi:hypothetical protein